MPRHFCLENPDTMTLVTSAIDSRPGRVQLTESPFFPGGGGQLPDRGRLVWSGGEVAFVGVEAEDGQQWHVLGEPVEIPSGPLEAVVDASFRQTMCELHTALHLVNALVYQRFNGALVTGAQMNDDGTARVDFDITDADNNLLRALEPEINDAIRQDLPVRQVYVAEADAYAQPGLIRSRSVTPPPTPDGKLRVVEIVGLDRQACGGTHLASTGRSRPVRILKIENKGRLNRRIRIGLQG